MTGLKILEEVMMNNGVLLDTCFLIKLLNSKDDLHSSAKDYYSYFLSSKIQMYISTITIAKYCIRGKIEDIPMKHIKILPFNWSHAIKAGSFMETVFRQKNSNAENIRPRAIIPNDSKLFAQVAAEELITCFVTSDEMGKKIYNIIRSEHSPNFEYWDVNIPLSQCLNELPF